MVFKCPAKGAAAATHARQHQTHTRVGYHASTFPHHTPPLHNVSVHSTTTAFFRRERTNTLTWSTCTRMTATEVIKYKVIWVSSRVCLCFVNIAHIRSTASAALAFSISAGETQQSGRPDEHRLQSNSHAVVRKTRTSFEFASTLASCCAVVTEMSPSLCSFCQCLARWCHHVLLVLASSNRFVHRLVHINLLFIQIKAESASQHTTLFSKDGHDICQYFLQRIPPTHPNTSPFDMPELHCHVNLTTANSACRTRLRI